MEIGIRIHRGLDGNRQALQLDVAFLVTRLSATFPGIEFEEEYFESHIRRIRQQLTEQPSGQLALRIAERDAQERGPGFRFTVRSEEGIQLQGGLSRYSISFRFSEKTPEDIRKAAQAMLDSFAITKIKNEDKQ